MVENFTQWTSLNNPNDLTRDYLFIYFSNLFFLLE